MSQRIEDLQDGAHMSASTQLAAAAFAQVLKHLLQRSWTCDARKYLCSPRRHDKPGLLIPRTTGANVSLQHV